MSIAPRAPIVETDRKLTCELLGHLAEIDARKAYLPLGYSSLFAYCTQRLRLSESGA